MQIGKRLTMDTLFSLDAIGDSGQEISLHHTKPKQYQILYFICQNNNEIWVMNHHGDGNYNNKSLRTYTFSKYNGISFLNGNEGDWSKRISNGGLVLNNSGSLITVFGLSWSDKNNYPNKCMVYFGTINLLESKYYHSSYPLTFSLKGIKLI